MSSKHTISPAGDPFTASAATHHDHQDERPHVCYEGVVFIGEMVDDYMGGEVEIFWPVPCRRCTDSR
jgi:hypothetical protein